MVCGGVSLGSKESIPWNMLCASCSLSDSCVYGGQLHVLCGGMGRWGETLAGAMRMCNGPGSSGRAGSEDLPKGHWS